MAWFFTAEVGYSRYLELAKIHHSLQILQYYSYVVYIIWGSRGYSSVGGALHCTKWELEPSVELIRISCRMRNLVWLICIYYISLPLVEGLSKDLTLIATLEELDTTWVLSESSTNVVYVAWGSWGYSSGGALHCEKCELDTHYMVRATYIIQYL